jgi:hypothetical protein
LNFLDSPNIRSLEEYPRDICVDKLTVIRGTVFSLTVNCKTSYLQACIAAFLTAPDAAFGDLKEASL